MVVLCKCTDSSFICDRADPTNLQANEQHYGIDPAFFQSHLGPCLKYSACEWPPGEGASLAEAEVHTIRKYQEMAGLDGLEPGSRVLELG